jgi:hypothetical protein
MREQIYEPREGHCNKSKLASHVFEEGHQIDWTNKTKGQFDPKSVSRKYK